MRTITMRDKDENMDRACIAYSKKEGHDVDPEYAIVAWREVDALRERIEQMEKGASGDYSPTVEQVERVLRETPALVRNYLNEGEQKLVARFILKRQHEREKGLVQTLRRIKYLTVEGSDIHTAASDALAAHARLDAPPEPTLLEAAKALVGRFNWVADSANVEALDALKAAVEREERAK